MINYLLSLAGYSQNTWTTAKNLNQDFSWALVKVGLKLLAIITVLWLINIVGWQVLNLIPFFGVTILLIAVGFSPIALSATALAGTITRADQIKGVPTGIPAGAQIWIVQVLPALIVSCHILIGFLATWSFAANPIAFWYFAMACVTIGTAMLAWKELEGKFLYKLVIAYSTVVAVFALFTTQVPEATHWLDHDGRVELQQQQQVEVRQAEIEEAQHNARVAAQAAIAAQAVAAEAEANLEQASGDPCGGRWTGLPGCESVTFTAGQKYDRTAVIGTCLSMDPPDAAVRTSLGGNEWRHIPVNPGVTIRFFDHPVGETILGATCG